MGLGHSNYMRLSTGNTSWPDCSLDTIVRSPIEYANHIPRRRDSNGDRKVTSGIDGVTNYLQVSGVVLVDFEHRDRV